MSLPITLHTYGGWGKIKLNDINIVILKIPFIYRNLLFKKYVTNETND
jgi:hypothetical protein